MSQVVVPSELLQSIRIRLSLFILFAACLFLPPSALAQVNFTGASTRVSGDYNFPIGVAVDANGNLYIADTLNNAVKEILAVNGTIPSSPTAVTLAAGFNAPEGVAVDTSGNVYVADTGNNAVKEILAVDGAIPASPTIVTLANPVLPYSMALDPLGDLFIAGDCPVDPAPQGQTCGEVLELIAVNGNISPSSATQLVPGAYYEPATLAFDGSGNLYVANYASGTIVEVLATSGIINSSSTTNTIATVNHATGIALDPSGNLFVSVYDSSELYEIFAVNGSIPASPTIMQMGNGLSKPAALSPDGNGGVYIANAGDGDILDFHPLNVPFGSVAVSSNANLALGFSIASGTTVGSAGILTTGLAGKDFTDAGSSSCTAHTYTIAVNCVINVHFSPLAAGLRRGAVVLYDGSGNVLASVPVYGIGTAPQVAFRPGIQSLEVSGLSNPIGLATDAAGNIFVADEYNNAVKEILADGGYSTINTLAGTYTAANGFNQPTSVAVDGAGNIFLADSLSNSVKEIVAAGGYTNVITLATGFYYVWGIAVDGAGNVFASDVYNGYVEEFTAASGYTTGVILSGYSGSPKGIALDASGNLFIGDVNSNSIIEVPAAGGYSTSNAVISGLNNPTAVALDAAENIYVADTNNLAVKEFLAVGDYSTVVSFGSSFMYPQGVALDSKGNVFFTDTGNGTILMQDVSDSPTLDFAATNLNATSTDSPRIVSIANVGNSALTLTALAYPPDFPEATGDTNSCTGSSSLGAGQQCDLPINFTPQAGGALSESVTFTDNALNVSGAIQSVGVAGTGQFVAGQVTHFSVSGASPVPVGGAFSVIVTALDGFNHTATGYTGTVHFASSDSNAALPANATLSSGTGSFVVTMNTLGSQTVSVTDTLNSSATGSAVFQVTPGAATHFAFSTLSPAYVGGSFSFTVAALDVDGNVATGYTGTAQFTSTDLAAVLPSSSTLSAGVGTFSATFMTVGSQSITATDSVASAIVGTSNAASVTIPNLVVSTANDDGGTSAHCTPQSTPGTGTDAACALRDALSFAQANGSANITFDSTVFSPANSTAQNTITLTNGVLLLPSNVTVSGPTTKAGQTVTNLVTISGANSFGVVATNGDVTNSVIDSLNITGAAGTGLGNAGTLTVNNTTIFGNATTGGAGDYVNAAGVSNSGTLTLNNSTVTGNTTTATGDGGAATGGGISNHGTMVVTNSTIAQNSAISASSAAYGGGIYNTATLTVIASTISGNSVSSTSGPAYGGGITNFGTMSLANTIVAGNMGLTYADVKGPFTDNGGNQAGSDPSGTSVVAINLAPLANYGGPTLTMLPLPGSPAICAGTAVNLGSRTTDQRGLALDSNCTADAVDSGAVQTNYALAFSTEPPASVSVSQAISPAPAVQLTENGAVTTSASNSVAMTDGASLLTGTTLASLSSGVASFSNINLSSVTSNDTLTATLALTSSVSITAASTAISAAKQTPTITWSNPTAISYGTALGTAQLNATASVDGTFVYSPAAGAVLGAATQTLSVTFTPANTNAYSTATANVQLTVNQATPSITWNTPSAITYGTALSTTQLDATSTIAGTFVYSPSSGAVLGAGSQTLSVTFTPTDTTDYSTATSTVQLAVNQATPSITWAQPTPIAYGTGLSGAQLNASSPVAGTFVYTPAASTVLSAGPQTLSVVFTPTDTTDYTTANSSVSITVDQQAALTSPANGSVLPGSTATFTWSVGGGVTQYELWLGTTGIGSSNIYNSGAITAASASPTGLPANGVNLYARLWSRINGAWQSADYTFTEAGTASQASLTSPAPGSVLSGANVTFSWTPGSGPTQYELWISAVGYGLSDLFNSGAITANSTNVPNLPTNGTKIFVRLYSRINGGFQSTDYTYTEAGTPTLAALTSPAPGSQLPGAGATFSWTAGAGPTGYQLWLSTVGVGQSELYNSGATAATSVNVTGLPTNGVKVYARLWSMISGGWQSTDYTYTEFGTASQAVLTSPTPSSTLSGANVTFSWTPGTGTTGYQLWLSTVGAGQSELYNSGVITATSASLTGLPTTGVKVFARLWSRISNAWQSTDYTFTEAGSPTLAALTSPAPSSTLSGGSVTFSWSAGAGPSGYQLWIGTNGVGSSDLYNSGTLATSVTSANVPNMPANGVTIYARMWSRVNGGWQSIDYTYTESGSPSLAALTSPNPGSTLLGGNVTFTWSAGAGPTAYQLWLGSTGVASSDLFNSGSTTTTSANVTNLPTTGALIYVRLWSKINGRWQSVDYTVTQFGTVSQAMLTSPAPGSVLTGANVTFSWTTGSGPVAYELWLGSTGIGSSNLYNSGSITATSASPTNLPTNGSIVYARLWSRINGAWQSTDYRFIAQ